MRRKDREVTERELLEKIISRCDVCRVAFADGDTPYMVTMNFGYTAGEKQVLWFHCAREGRKLDMMRRNNYVFFSMDTDHLLVKGPEPCDWGMKYSSVTGYGRLSEVTDNDERLLGLNAIMDHYGWEGGYEYKKSVFSRTTVLKLEIDSVSGKALA